MKVVKFKRFSPLSQKPTRATPGSVGYGLFSAKNVEIKPNSLQKVSTNVDLKIPKGHYGRICPCSNYALKFTGIGGGVINSHFGGNISVIFFSFLNKFY